MPPEMSLNWTQHNSLGEESNGIAKNDVNTIYALHAARKLQYHSYVPTSDAGSNTTRSNGGTICP
jgi:putative salt-induced outer membrane protein YdiY